jgi:hypothetical protein
MHGPVPSSYSKLVVTRMAIGDHVLGSVDPLSELKALLLPGHSQQWRWQWVKVLVTTAVQ